MPSLNRNNVQEFEISLMTDNSSVMGTSLYSDSNEIDVDMYAAGEGISSTIIEYQTTRTNQYDPSGTWSTEFPQNISQGDYLWIKNTYIYTNGETKVSYSGGYFAKDALINGENVIDIVSGNDSITVTKTGTNLAISYNNANHYVTETDLNNEITARQNADTNLQNTKANISETGSSISATINTSTYVMTLSLKDKNNNILNTQTIDLPLETMVVNGTYDSTNKKIILTLQNGNTIDIPVGDLVSGLQTEITSQNKLSSDLIDDSNNTNLFTTTTEKTAWNNKLDSSALTDYVKNTDYATASKGGVVKTSGDFGTYVNNNGILMGQGKNYTSYQTANNNLIISKQTLENAITGKNLETSNNKVTSISSSSTDTQYPSAKCVYDELGNKLDSGDIAFSADLSAGTKIGTITIEGNPTDIYAPSGGGGTGGVHYTLTKNGNTISLNGDDASVTSVTDDNTIYTAGTNISIDANNVISAIDTTYNEATTSTAGLLSAADKTKLNGVADNIIVSSTEPITGEKIWVKKGKNLFDPENITYNWYIVDGTSSPADGYPEHELGSSTLYLSPIFYVKPGNKYYLTQNSNDTNVVYGYGASDPVKFTGTISGNQIITEINIPSNSTINYIQFSGLLEFRGDVQFEQNNINTTVEGYIPNQIYIKNSNNNYELLYPKEELYSDENIVQFPLDQLIVDYSGLFSNGQFPQLIEVDTQYHNSIAYYNKKTHMLSIDGFFNINYSYIQQYINNTQSFRQVMESIYEIPIFNLNLIIDLYSLLMPPYYIQQGVVMNDINREERYYGQHPNIDTNLSTGTSLYLGACEYNQWPDQSFLGITLRTTNQLTQAYAMLQPWNYNSLPQKGFYIHMDVLIPQLLYYPDM